MSITRHHADWLSLVEVSGPFVSLPVLMQAFPQGLEPRDPAQARVLRAAYEEWHDNPAAPGNQRAWVMHVLTSILGYPENQVTEGQTLPAGLEASMPEVGETLRPDFALVGPGGTATAGQPQLLIAIYSAEQGLDKPVIGKHWKVTPATRMMELLHGANVPLGLVTNGEQWMLVYAPRGETTGYASWYGALWLDEPITLRAFHSLLGVRRFFGVAADSTLLSLLKESASDQQEVTDQLGYQVREAVEVLVQSFDALDKEVNRALLKGVKPATLYDSALTVMMRLVFMFSAEERGLLHLGKPLYDDNYAVSTLQEQLQEVADRHGEEVLERRYDAWVRLLATFRAVHGGIQHQDLLMQAYGGSLFNPDRYPFLEGRPAGTHWRSASAEPLAVNNRVVLHLLNSLQRLRTKVGAGGTAETRRVSFRALGVEQIGHVYEGLLDHTALRANEAVLGIRGTRSKEPEIPLTTLEALLTQGEDKLIGYLKEETGRAVSALRRELTEGSFINEHRLRIACDQNETLLARLRPFAGLIRDDSFERPWVVLPGSCYVTTGTTRRSTGTHYTPPSLTEPIVQHTLESLVYVGPAEGTPREQWKLKSPKDILDLKVCDMAMGSGAFLVQVCRYLAERLVEAWENEEKQHPGEILITPEGNFSKASASERLLPADANERMAIARRVVADRCLYGVDINPMAVEMAKLSLWLITVDAKRPFTFLDHAFKCGDSLLGITSQEHLENFSLHPGGGKQHAFTTLDLRRHIDEAQKKRELLEAMPSDTPEQIAAKAALFLEAEDAVAKLNATADVLLAIELKGLKGRAYEVERETAAERTMACWAQGLPELRAYADERLGGRHSFHWALAFPEIVNDGGFDAFVGNPPFLGGQKISGVLGSPYRDFIVDFHAQGRKGSADLSVFFLLNSCRLIRESGVAGLVLTSAIAEGDNREVGLEHLDAVGTTIYRADTSKSWPGTATVTFSAVWFSKTKWHGNVYLNGNMVSGLSPFLTPVGGTTGKPYRLMANAGKSFIGHYVLGMGFLMEPRQAKDLIEKYPNNQDVLFPFLNGSELNATWDSAPTRWVINFRQWPLSRESAPLGYSGPVASDYPDCLEIVRKLVKPERDKNNRPRRRERWWLFGDFAPSLELAMQKDKLIFAISMTAAKHIAFCRVEKGNLLSHTLAVLALDRWAEFGVVSSSFHDHWTRLYTSYNLALPRYIHTDCFLTYPFPDGLTALDEVSLEYHILRSKIMESRREGLTATYNRFHDAAEVDEDIRRLRRLQIALDRAVAGAYGWSDLSLAHDFYETAQGVRYTISEEARRDALDRLLALNHRRYAEQEAERATRPDAALAKRGRKKRDIGGQILMDF